MPSIQTPSAVCILSSDLVLNAPVYSTTCFLCVSSCLDLGLVACALNEQEFSTDSDAW